MMLSEEALHDAIFQAALKSCDCEVKNNRQAIWTACIAMMSDVLRESDPFTAARLLRSLVPRLREAAAHLEELLGPPASPYPRIMH
jgi:hypothetical protein